ncbi:unnamed protein product [Aureobasidium pullulans]|nr:unnamed protein product [Aureobasidium pullulans]
MGLRELIFPAALWLGAANAQSIPSGAVSSHVASSGFPTSVFSSYWVKPVATAEPQPALYDPVLNVTFPLNLTDPDTISEESNDPVSYPSPIANLTSAGKQAVLDSIISQVKEIIGSEQLTTNCSKCIASLTVAKSAAQLAPELIPDTMVSLCKKYKFQSNETCEESYEATTFGAIWTQILALSDVAGLDGQYICNRLSTPYYGDFKCDSPYGLVLAALDSIAPLTGTNQKEPFGFSIYTGDLVSHEGQQELSRDLPDDLGMQMSWNFDHVAGLWQEEGWLNSTAANQARLHYGAYSVKTPQGLRVITFNTDFWYRSNYLNLIDTINPDKSGMFAWMIEELQRAEDAGERVWILGHVLSGWDGTNPMPNPTDLFYQIIDRYSPHVIANVFFGHTHEDFAYVYYANNGTNQSAGNALNTAWVGPSITPLTNVNSAFRSYEVDTGDWNIYEAYTFYSDVESFSSLNTTGPTFQFEYNTRDTYGPSINWPAEAPLNATFWHLVSEQIEKNTTLASTFNTYQGKSSVKSPNCTNIACAKAKACYMRSGSVALGSQCPQGYGSVQSPFKPTS